MGGPGAPAWGGAHRAGADPRALAAAPVLCSSEKLVLGRTAVLSRMPFSLLPNDCIVMFPTFCYEYFQTQQLRALHGEPPSPTSAFTLL